jgi:hypothetical protein
MTGRDVPLSSWPKATNGGSHAGGRLPVNGLSRGVIRARINGQRAAIPRRAVDVVTIRRW